MWLVKVLSVIYFTACAAQDSPDEPPVPSLQQHSERSDVFPSESVELSCSFPGSSGWTFAWYRDAQRVRDTDPNVYISPQGSNLKITAAPQTSSGTYSCEAHLTSTGVTTSRSNSVKITVHDPPEPSLKLLSSWPDVFENETVVFRCDVHSPDWTISWYRDGNKDDLAMLAEGSFLNITWIDYSYEGDYTCKAHLESRRVNSKISNTVAVTVYDNVPTAKLTKVPDFNPMFVGETVNLECKVPVSSGWKYQWYKNGIELHTTKESNRVKLSFSDHGTYQCRAARGEITSTDFSEEIKQDVLEIPVPSLKSTAPWLDVFPTESVELGCAMDGAADWVYTWYKHGHEVQAGDVDSLGSNGATLSIRSASAKHRGQYSCRGQLNNRPVSSNFSAGLTLNVYDEKPSVTLTQDPQYSVMFPGESVSFRCNISVSSVWKYMWFKDGVPLNEPGHTYSLNSVETANRGSYSCQAHRSVDKPFLTDSSPAIRLEVQGTQPKPLMTQVPDVQKVYTGESVSFKCKVELSSGWRYHLIKDGKQLLNNDGGSFDIRDANSFDDGTYKCSATRDITMYNTSHSDGRTIHVSEIPVPSLTSVTPWLDVFPGESVTFGCGMAAGLTADWTFSWFKDKKPVQADRATSFDSNAATLSISSASASHGGQYSCLGKLKSRPVVTSNLSHALTLDVHGTQPKPLMTQVPDVQKVYTGESVSFKCKVELSSGWRYHLIKDGKQLLNNDGGSFDIRDANSFDDGTYKCSATRDITMYNTSHSDGRTIHVSEIPVPSLTSVTPWLDVFPGESVTFGCGMAAGLTADWTFSWFKDKKPVQADRATSFDSNAATLSISSASASHGGQYSCLGKLKSRPVVTSNLSHALTLDVHDEKPRVTLMQSPTHNVMHTGDPVSFSCHINVSSGWEHLWFKDGQSLTASGNNHTIEAVETKHTGSYQCQAKRGKDGHFSSDRSPAVRLDVKERPQAGITLLTGWSEVFSTDSLVLKCEVHESQGVWNYTWFKAEQQLSLPPSAKHTVTPQNDPEQSQYTCRGISTGRPSYSRFSDSLQTRNLLLKRRVLLSISGCIFFGIIAVLLGCIFLRLFRKPADGEDRPAEAELFITMAQLRERDDATCPMVQYLTDAELNAPSKEADENGTICSETTQLPITSPEEQVVTSESEDATEKNGGLISFK
ncbi:basement membrane-specific heparan sulfate proteoglycan core protein [Spinachia spinachia]